MKTIHITSQDELPQVAGAIIGSLGRRTVVAFRGVKSPQNSGPPTP